MKSPTFKLFEDFPWNRSRDEDVETDSSDGLLEKDLPRTTNGASVCQRLVVLCILLASIFFNAILFIERRSFSNLDRVCSRYTSQPSPILEDVEIVYKPLVFNASLVRKTIYREEPSIEVDQAWDDLGGKYRVVRIAEEDGPKYGLRQNDHVKFLPENGGGFPVNVEVLHHIHCVDLLRQTNHYNFAYYQAKGEGAFKNSEPNLRDHIGHCIDVLRQELMCQADYGVFGQVWVEKYDALTDFFPQHMCKNFEAIREWAKDNQMPTSGLGSMVRFRETDVMLKEVP